MNVNVNGNKRVILENEKERTDFYRFLQEKNFKKRGSVLVDTTFLNDVEGGWCANRAIVCVKFM